MSVTVANRRRPAASAVFRGRPAACCGDAVNTMTDSASPDSPPAAAVEAARGTPRRFAQVLSGNIVFIILHAILLENTLWLMPMLVRLRFGSANTDIKDWQTTLITAALATCLIFSIFWGELLRRVPFWRYVAIYWAVAILPLAGLAWVQNYAQLLTLYVIAAVGQAGWAPLYGRLLKDFYPDAIRGRVFALVNGARLAAGIVAGFAVGGWVQQEPEAFRFFFAGAVGLHAVGMLVLAWIVRLTNADRRAPEPGHRDWRGILEPILHAHRTLRADRVFARYEAAFMTYGAAFMICDVLLPVLATERLGMGYQDFAHSTRVILLAVMLIMILPMGWLLDRLGAIRTSGIAFAALAFYPLLLLCAWNNVGVGIASAINGIGLAGVMMGWMLGPVALAPSADKTAQYVAIHATMVGLRGIVFQGLGMLFYKLTGSFVAPLIVAALMFAAGSWQMWLLHGDLRRGAQSARTGTRTSRGPASSALFGAVTGTQAQPTGTELVAQPRGHSQTTPAGLSGDEEPAHVTLGRPRRAAAVQPCGKQP